MFVIQKMEYQIPSILIAVAVLSLASVRMVYFKILKLAKDKGLVDNPDARKLQKKPVPVVGGLAVFLGVVVGVLSGCVLLSLTELDSESGMRLIPILLSMSVMLYSGTLDDIVGLTPTARFAIEIFTLLAIIFATDISIEIGRAHV